MLFLIFSRDGVKSRKQSNPHNLWYFETIRNKE